MRSNVLLLPKLFLSPALSRHCRRSSQHSPEYRVQILHGGPQHPHPHSQQQQLQPYATLHARSEGGVCTSKQTGGTPGQKNPELLRAVDQWTGGEGPVGGGGSSSFHRKPHLTKNSEMYENPVKFFYVPFIFSDATQTQAMLWVARSGESKSWVQQRKGSRLHRNIQTSWTKRVFNVNWKWIHVWEFNEYARIALKISKLVIRSFIVLKEPNLQSGVDQQWRQRTRRFRNIKGICPYSCWDYQNKCSQ